MQGISWKLKFFGVCPRICKTFLNSRLLTSTVWPEPIWIKVSGWWWQIPPQYQSTYLRGPESASIEIYLVKVPLSVNIVKQDLLHKNTVFENFMKWGLKGGISIDADSGPPRYVLWSCSVIFHYFLTFVQNGYGRTVISKVFLIYITH